MTATTTSTWKPSHAQSHSRSARPSTTPRGYPAVSSVGQAMPPQHPTSPPLLSPQTRKGARSPSPSYFGLAVNNESLQPDSNPGQHAQQNWKYSGSSRGSVAATPRHESNETNPAFAAFRKQSESYGFSLNNTPSGLSRSSTQAILTPSARRTDESPISPHARRPPVARFESEDKSTGKRQAGEPSFFDIPKQGSPMSMSPVPNSVSDHQHARLSLPASALQGPLSELQKKQRSDTLPPPGSASGPVLSSPQNVAKILETQFENVLLLDLRVFPQYAAGRVKGALNLCIPTTLLKRPSFTVQKLADTFTSEHDKNEFAKWETSAYIIVYDANSNLPQEAVMPFNVLKKFTTLGWKGQGLVIKGGFLGFSKAEPKLIERGEIGSATQSAPVSAPNQAILPVAGGCFMPETESAANPFFGNIRQNMDLLDGVGQMSIKMPTQMSADDEATLPAWLKKAAGSADEGKQVSDKFLKIERGEQKRMQQALSANVQYGTPSKESSDRVQVAGIEKGSKNRYNNIFPFDHTRVKLQGVSSGDCDYVNASFVQASHTNRKYIATQAPTPATFGDFWRMVWEQDVRVVVMLTAESEGGQVKSHAYWNSGEYGSLKLKKLSERQVALEKQKSKNTITAAVRPSLGTRRSTQPNPVGDKQNTQEPKSSPAEAPFVTVRHFTLSHSAHPFRPMREVTQLQYTQWPDFGAPASPTALLGLIEQVNKYVRSTTTPHGQTADDIAPESQRPILVHCSAGCGRTGTFCTVDSVIDMLKRQSLERKTHDADAMDVDGEDDWALRDDTDLIAATVSDFRGQRLSMVQNLRQFVLCYESILQWIVSQEHDDTKQQQKRLSRGKSYHGSMS